MAEGRDFRISILSDVDKFDLARPADELDDLATAAEGTARDVDKSLDKLGDSAKKADKSLDTLGDSKGLDELGNEAKATANKVDDAFDRIAKSSRSNMRKVDDDLDRASKGMDDFKDEAHQSAREGAASFTGGFEDVADYVQEVAANAFGGFGKMGAVAGLAAAAGIGFIVNSVTEARERVRELASDLLDLRLSDDWDTDTGKLTAFLDELKDSGDINRFRDAASKAGISFDEWARAMASGGPELDRLAKRIGATNDAGGGFERMMTSAGRATTDLENRTRDQIEAHKAAAEAAGTYEGTLGSLATKEKAAEKAAEAHAEAVDSLASAIDDFADPASTYNDLLAEKERKERQTAQATANATKDQSDSWEDYAKDVDVSIGEYLAALERQVTAQEDWASNLAALAKRGVDNGVLDQLARLGPEGAPLVAKLTKASDAELAKMVSLYDRQGRAAGQEIAQGIAEAIPSVGNRSAQLRAEVRERLRGGGPIGISTSVYPPSYAELAGVRSSIRSSLAGISVSVLPIVGNIMKAMP